MKTEQLRFVQVRNRKPASIVRHRTRNEVRLELQLKLGNLLVTRRPNLLLLVFIRRTERLPSPLDTTQRRRISSSSNRRARALRVVELPDSDTAIPPADEKTGGVSSRCDSKWSGALRNVCSAAVDRRLELD